jgi:hypothetical protein
MAMREFTLSGEIVYSNKTQNPEQNKKDVIMALSRRR